MAVVAPALAFWNERKVAEEAYAAPKEEEEDDEGQGQVNPSVQISE